MSRVAIIILTIFASLIAVLISAIGILYFLDFYTSKNICQASKQEVQALEYLLLQPEPVIEKKGRELINESIREFEQAIDRLNRISQEEREHELQKNINNAIIVCHEKIKTMEAQLKQPSQQIIKEEKKSLQNKLDSINNEIVYKQRIVQEIKEIELQNTTAKISSIEQLEESILNLQEIQKNLSAQQALPDATFLKYHRDELAEEILIEQKQCTELEKLLQSPEKLKKSADELWNKNLNQLLEEFNTKQAMLKMPKEQLIEYSKQMIQRKILKLKLEAQQINCNWLHQLG